MALRTFSPVSLPTKTYLFLALISMQLETRYMLLLLRASCLLSKGITAACYSPIFALRAEIIQMVNTYSS
jgi:hypothetical protein